MNWEAVFESELIPLVAAARSEEALERALGAIIGALFRRTDDQTNREQFFALMQVSLARAKDLPAKVDSAIGFLRLVKTTRQTLATQSPGKRREAAAHVSSDITALTRATAPPPVKLKAPPAAEAPAAEPPAKTGPSGFAAVFDHTVCAYLREVLALLRVETPDGMRLPCLAHPAFAEVLEEVLRAHILPWMRTARTIKALADSHNWDDESEGGAKAVRALLGADEYNNPVLHTWDNRWGEMAARRVSGKKSLPPGAKAVWDRFKAHAEQHGYAPPPAGEVELLLTLPRYDLARLRAAWREIGHLYEQEFAPRKHQDAARDGALRDALLKWETREGLPAHAVEWLTIRAAATLPHLGPDWLARFATNKGKTDEERRRAIPYVMQVVGGTARK